MKPYLPLDQILHGDCIEILNSLPENSVDLVFADPPYNLQLSQDLYRPNRTKVNAVNDRWDKFAGFKEYDEFTLNWLRAVRRVLKDTGTLWVIGTYHNIYRIGAILQDLGFWILNDVVWIKCLAATTYLHVKTENGERPMTIKDMVRLDPGTVRLWNGIKWVNVLGWEKHYAPNGCMEIVLRSGERIRCTPDHLWPTDKGVISASELQVGDILQTCRLPQPEQIVAPAQLEDGLIGWFVGLYLAEGSRSEDTIMIAGHIKEGKRLERLKELARAFHGTCAIHQTSENGCTINLNGKILNAIIDTYISGNTAKYKHLSPKCWQRSNAFLESLLDGYLDGDGHYDAQNNRWRLGFTKNLELEADFRALCARLGVSVRIRPYNLKQHERTYPTLRGEIRFERKEHLNTKNDAEIMAIGKSWATDAWDIAVESEPNLFALASGVLTHNSNPMPNFRGVRFTNAHETLIWAQKKKGAKYTFNHHAMKTLNDDGRENGLQMRSDWYLPLATGRERIRDNGAKAHSTQKPEALLYRVILASSKPGDVVLDPFFGSGTTGAVAKKLGRHFIGIEREKKYIKIAQKRIDAVQPADSSSLDVAMRRPARIPFGALLEHGLLTPGQTLYFAQNGKPAKVLANGHIRCGKVTGSIHSVARSLLNNAPANGWELWLYKDKDGRKKPIDTLRQLLHKNPANLPS